MKKRVSILLPIMVTVMILAVTGCSSAGETYDNPIGDIVDQAANVVQSVDENVIFVKNGSPYTHPNTTYDEAFSNFFGSPAWKYFKGTSEGPDEDGDGKPDSVEADLDVVEFTGYCTYDDVEVKALIQFVLDKNEGTFESKYLSFNDVPQNMLMLSGLIEKAFSIYEEEHGVIVNETGEADIAEVQNEETTLAATESYEENDGDFVIGEMLNPIIVEGIADDITDYFNGIVSVYSYSGDECIYDFESQTYYVPDEQVREDYYSKERIYAAWAYQYSVDSLSDELVSNMMDIYTSYGEYMQWAPIEETDFYDGFISIYRAYFYYKTRLDSVSSLYEEYCNDTQPIITEIHNIIRGRLAHAD